MPSLQPIMAVILIGSGRPVRIGDGFLLPVRRIAIGDIILLERRSVSALHLLQTAGKKVDILGNAVFPLGRSEEHTSALQSLMRLSYAVFCLQQKIDIHCS